MANHTPHGFSGSSWKPRGHLEAWRETKKGPIDDLSTSLSSQLRIAALAIASPSATMNVKRVANFTLKVG